MISQLRPVDFAIRDSMFLNGTNFFKGFQISSFPY